jgi:hypothetical protein
MMMENLSVKGLDYFREKLMESGGGVWHGMTIRDILEKVDLFNITTVEDGSNEKIQMQKEFSPITLGNYETTQDGKTIIPVSDPTSAYLGK